MSLVILIVLIVVAACLLGTCIWWFDAKVTIPGPFAWAKGILSWVMVCGACYLIWSVVIAPYLAAHGHRF